MATPHFSMRLFPMYDLKLVFFGHPKMFCNCWALSAPSISYQVKKNLLCLTLDSMDYWLNGSRNKLHDPIKNFLFFHTTAIKNSSNCLNFQNFPLSSLTTISLYFEVSIVTHSPEISAKPSSARIFAIDYLFK